MQTQRDKTRGNDAEQDATVGGSQQREESAPETVYRRGIAVPSALEHPTRVKVTPREIMQSRPSVSAIFLSAFFISVRFKSFLKMALYASKNCPRPTPIATMPIAMATYWPAGRARTFAIASCVPSCDFGVALPAIR